MEPTVFATVSTGKVQIHQTLFWRLIRHEMCDQVAPGVALQIGNHDCGLGVLINQN